MKNTLLSITVLLAALSASGQVSWLETEREMGAFAEEAGPMSVAFRMVNTGAEPVSIVKARASCGCTSPDYTTEPIAPGDTASVTVTYDPAGRPGRFTKYVSVSLSDGSAATKLYIRGSVVGAPQTVAKRYPQQCTPEIMLSRDILMTGEVNKGMQRTVFLEAYNRSTDTIHPLVTRAPAYYTIKPTPEAVAPGEQLSFICYFNSGKCPLYGMVTDTIYIAPNPGTEGCAVEAVALVREDFSKLTDKELAKAPVARLADERIDMTGRTTAITTLRNMGRSPLTVRRIYSQDAGVRATIDRTNIKPGKAATITFEAIPETGDGTLLNARFALITNDPANPTQTIRVVGEIK